MTEYEYRVEIMRDAAHRPGDDPTGETVDLPDDAVGVSVDTFGGDVWVRYLAPADGGDDAEIGVLGYGEAHVADGGDDE